MSTSSGVKEGPANGMREEDHAAHHFNKKARSSQLSVIQEGMLPPLPFRQTLLDVNEVKGLRESYPQAIGYPHCVVKNVMELDHFRALRTEMVESLSATFKETDLFKLYQTGDLANLDAKDQEMAARLPCLIRLREAIYSSEFRAFVSEITGCPALVDRTDCSSNLYAQGCHLLCHDDVIGTRCVSFIIYLTDPDELWEEADGGSLEIYPLSEHNKLGSPAVTPIKSYLPQPNSMAFFTVLPGRSFHAVEEVYREGKMRLSISGWYHADHPPEGADMASLSQLQTREVEAGMALTPISRLVSIEPSQEEKDVALLSQWVNRTYLSASAISQILQRFKQDKSVLLHGFLLPEHAKEIARLSQARDQADNVGGTRKPPHEIGYGEGWEAVGPPHKQRYLRYTPTASSTASCCPCGSYLARLQHDLIASGAFARLLQRLSSLQVTAQSAEVRRFRPGLDYTLAHYGILTTDPKLDVSICFVKDRSEGEQEAWSLGDVGGFGCYIKADEGNDGAEAAESYRPNADQSEDLLSVFAASNALSLVLREKSAMRFIKYVSAPAPGSRWDIAAEFHLAKEEEREGETTAAGKA